MRTSSSFSTFFIFYFFIFLFSYFLIAISPVSAQLGLGLSPSDIPVTVTPENPGPNQKVTISIDSFATDLNAAKIIWSVNGKTVLSGTGQKQLTTTTGTLGQKTSVHITIYAQNGTVEEDISLVPSTINLIWEAYTYTPPFFKGKALFSPQSNLLFIAIPHIMRNGSEIPASNLIYKWSNNGTVLGDSNGYGKNTLSIPGSILPRPMDITVEATDPISGGLADGESVLAPQTPFVLLYKNDPLYGVQYEKALQGSFPLTGNEVDITAVPYYFSAVSRTDDVLSYNWEINSLPLQDGLNSPDKVFRQVGNVFGISNISVSVSQNQTMFQIANQSVLIDFKKNTGQTSL